MKGNGDTQKLQWKIFSILMVAVAILSGLGACLWTIGPLSYFALFYSAPEFMGGPTDEEWPRMLAHILIDSYIVHAWVVVVILVILAVGPVICTWVGRADWNHRKIDSPEWPRSATWSF